MLSSSLGMETLKAFNWHVGPLFVQSFKPCIGVPDFALLVSRIDSASSGAWNYNIENE